MRGNFVLVSNLIDIVLGYDVAKNDSAITNVRIRLFNLIGNVVKRRCIKNKEQQLKV